MDQEGPEADAEGGRGGGRIRRRNQAVILAAAERVFAESGFAGASMAQIAAAAGLPKANLHYYFGTKEQLYRAVLTGILEIWLNAADGFAVEADPAQVLGAYVRMKLRLSRDRPLASRVFANEILHGAPHLRDYLERELRQWVEGKAVVIDAWVAAGRMTPISPRHLFFVLWAMTQTYADFEVQIRAVLGLDQLDEDAFAAASETVTALVLRGCGLSVPAPAGGRRR